MSDNPQERTLEPVWLPSDEAAAYEQYIRLHSYRLPALKLAGLRFMWFWRLGDLRRIHNRLELHNKAVELDKEDRRIKKVLEPEAVLYIRWLSDALTRRGFSDMERVEGRRRVRHRVKFRTPVYMTETAFYVQCLTTKQGLFGSKTMLPYRIRASDLVSQETLNDISITLNRRVTARWEPGKGLWFIIHRTTDMSGLPKLVGFREMLQFFRQGRAELCLGVGDNRAVHMCDLADVPHALIAGETGGGKSNTLNGMISYLIRFNQPRDLKLILIDLKNGTELLDYEDVPHLVIPIVTDNSRAAIALQQALALIKWRYSRMARLRPRPRNLDQYNQKMPAEHRWPRLVIVIDELAELLLGKGREDIEHLMIRICQLGRAAGVHMIAATQRPQKEIVNTAISANMQLKLAHKMSRAADSLTILGTGHAAELDDVPGRACYKKSWQVHAVQPPLIRPENVAESVAIALQMEPYELRLPDIDASRALAANDGAIVDYEAQLVRVLRDAGGRLSYDALNGSLGLDRASAAIFQQRVAGLVFEHEGQTYRVNEHGRSFAIQPVAPPQSDDDDDDELAVIVSAPSNGRWISTRKRA